MHGIVYLVEILFCFWGRSTELGILNKLFKKGIFLKPMKGIDTVRLSKSTGNAISTHEEFEFSVTNDSIANINE